MSLSGVDLNLLVAFDVLMAEGSVSRAAERMSAGQPAMSATLGRLRRLFDDPLLVRQGRALVPTPLAASLVEPVHEILSSIERTLWPVRLGFDPATSDRTFSVMASDYVALVLLRPLLARLAHEAPDVRVRVRPLTPDFRDQLRHHLTDLMILPSDVLGSGGEHAVAPLFTDRYLCAVDRDNPDVGDTITIEQLSRQPYLAYNLGPMSSLVERQLDAAGITRNVEVSTEAFVLAPHLVQGTRLITLVHERLARAMPDQVAIRLLEPPVPLDPLTEVMVWTRRDEHDPGHTWFRRTLLQLAAEL